MLAMLSGIKPTSTKRDPMHETPGTPTGDYSPISGRVVKPSSLIVAGMDITTWPIVEIDVPAGPLGILLDGSCTDAALLDDFAPVTREGAPGAIEANGNVPHGSVLIGMDKLDFMQPRKSLEEIGTVLREAAHLKRQLRFKVPPLNHQKLAKNPHDDKSKLIIGPTSSATDPSEDVKAGGEWSNMLWSGLRAATTLTAAKTSTETVSPPFQPIVEPIVPSALKAGGPASFVQVTGMIERSLDSYKSPYVPNATDKVVSVEVPPGSLGLNLNGTVANRAVVLGFVPLPDGSRGTIERSGSVSPGAEIVEINGEDVSKEPLAGIRERLGRMSGEPRRLSFRLPPPIKLTVQPLPVSSTTPVASPTSASKVRRMSATSTQRMSLIQASLPTYREDIELRRRLELQLVMSYDRKELKFKEFWFAVHSEWMNRWALFAGKGGPEPGPITNHELLEPGFAIGEDPNRVAFVRPGLEIMKDFRFVTPMVWSLLAALHGPGDAPPIARFALDINSEAPEDVNEVLHEAKAQATGLATSIREKCQVEVK
ncbi:hypothetical protein PC128_g10838 [Phytophthora cactorum]|nr:hypothetical protein PC120_g19019 [Phytophthora cactorum]KAG3069466.1 hypothetical protein PC121_g9807 [Phytophthora cactorum]KAG3191655.1 hypothetical protein PC128_g10838 [Phytophthora cactorum]KAG4045333.1 hypothetical protein PC123_g19254 [Phytophthora cactorum]